MSLHCQTLLETLAGEALPEWDRFQGGVRIQRARAGQPFFLVDQTWPWLGVVTSGVVKLVYPLEDGGERIKSFVPEGGFFASLMALSPGGRTTFAAIALTDAQIEQLHYAE